MIKETIDMLGHEATDKVTGYNGVITSVSFDLYGCVMGWITPSGAGDKKLENGHWFDVARLDVAEKTVMPVPAFDALASKPAEYEHGAEAKGPPRA